MNKLPTFEECLEITKKNEAFTHRYREVDGFKISVFDYLLASYPDFNKPIEGSDLTAFELRGLCFTHELKKGLFHNFIGSIRGLFNEGRKEKVVERFLLLNKFFNINQCENYQYEDLKNKKIRKIMDKMDGSVMRFIRLPNGKIVIKSKTFFDNDQTAMGNKLYQKNNNLQKFIKETLDSKLAAIFELVSASNRIVIAYDKTELTLLQLRDEATGEYLDIYSHPLVKKYKIKTVKSEPIVTLEELMELVKTTENKEGWVVEFEDGSLVKIKTAWYCVRHNLIEKLGCENELMTLIVKNTIDDALSELEMDDPRREAINNMTKAYNHFVIHKVKEVLEFAKTYAGDKKEWAIQYRKEPLFPFAVKIINLPDDQKEDKLIAEINKYVLGEVYYLNKARRFIQEELKLPLLLQVILASEDSNTSSDEQYEEVASSVSYLEKIKIYFSSLFSK